MTPAEHARRRRNQFLALALVMFGTGLTFAWAVAEFFRGVQP